MIERFMQADWIRTIVSKKLNSTLPKQERGTHCCFCVELSSNMFTYITTQNRNQKKQLIHVNCAQIVSLFSVLRINERETPLHSLFASVNSGIRYFLCHKRIADVMWKKRAGGVFTIKTWQTRTPKISARCCALFCAAQTNFSKSNQQIFRNWRHGRGSLPLSDLFYCISLNWTNNRICSMEHVHN